MLRVKYSEQCLAHSRHLINVSSKTHTQGEEHSEKRDELGLRLPRRASWRRGIQSRVKRIGRSLLDKEGHPRENKSQS